MTTQSTLPQLPGLHEEPGVAAGTQVGEYVVEDKLGEGGFGSVYRARHPLIGKLAAIKVLSRKYSADPEIVSRFVSEARAVNQIRHRNIVDIFAFGQLEDGRSYFVMELLDGDPLDRYIRERGGLALDEALPILRAIGRALDAAHAKGITHRDLKPENIILARDDDGQVYPKLLDFGIAKLVGDAGFSTKHKTRTGTPIGTPYYMSPEQARGELVDHRSDIYSFGCVAYELLTGVVPFDGEHQLAIMMKQCSDDAVPPSVRAADNPELPALPEAVDQALAWLMQKAASDRPESLAIAIGAIEDAAGLPPSRPTPLPARLTPLPARGTAARADSHHDTAFAHTVAPAATTLPPAPRRSRALGYAVAGALAVGGALAAYVATRGTEPAPPPLAAVAPAPAPVPAPVPAPPEPRLVTLRIDGPPANTEVFGPSGPLGRVPGVVQLVRDDGELQLTLQAEGYISQTITVTPSRDDVLAITLAPRPAVTAKPLPKPTAKPRPKPRPAVAKPAPTTKPKPAPDPWTRN